MKTVKIISFIVALLVVIISIASYVISHPGIFPGYNIVAASGVALFQGVIAFFVVLAIGSFIYQLTKPRNSKVIK